MQHSLLFSKRVYPIVLNSRVVMVDDVIYERRSRVIRTFISSSIWGDGDVPRAAQEYYFLIFTYIVENSFQKRALS